jgi:predicted Zn-dependent protease
MRLLVLVAVWNVAVWAQSDALAAKSQQAKQLMATGRFADAAVVYEELVRAMPGNPGLVLNLGMAQHMAGRDREAIAQFERVLKTQPKALPALMLMGTSYMRLGEPAKAIGPLRRGLAITPADAQARQMLVDALLMVGRLDEAASELEKAIAADKSSPRLWYGLGKTFEALAQRAFEQLQRAAPDSAYVLVLVGEVQLSRGRNSSAFHLFQEALKKDRTARGANAGLAHVYRRTGHADWAAVAEKRESAPGAPDCAVKPYACHFASGRWRQAAAAARTAKSPEALFWLIRAYNKLAGEAFARLEELPPSAELHQVKAEVFRSQERHADSVRELEAALKLDPRDDRLQRELITSIYLSRDEKRAEPLIRERLRVEPNAPDLHYFLADILLEQQRHDEAIALLRQALALDAKLVAAHAALGRALMETGKQAAAVPHLEAARETDRDGSIHYQLSRAYQAAGRADLARTALERYQELSRAAAVGTEGVDAEITAP